MAYQLCYFLLKECTFCMVVYYHLYWAIETLLSRKMDNRGSKYHLIKCIKEQRVDGGLLFNPLGGLNNIRCTLRGFEKFSLAGIPSNLILNKRLYSTTGSLFFKKSIQLSHSGSNLSKSANSLNLNPWFVTGFTDGDGSFAVSITKQNSGIGWKILPMFTIGLDPKDLDLPP